jgi:tetratricopeptide (TPR) repeat protein
VPLTALVLAAGAVAAIALSGGGDGGADGSSAARTTGRTGTASTAGRSERRRTGSTARAATGSQSTPSQSKSTPSQSKSTQSQSQAQPSTSQPAAPSSSSSDPKELNNRGFALIQQGDSAGAVAPLQQSVQAFRQQGRTREIDYAFALFNLATALRATGHPDQAIPLLEERLKISDYKRGVVQRELRLAQQQAGQGDSRDSSGPGSGGGDSSGPGPGGDD